MADIDQSDVYDDEDDHEPADLPHPDDTEDIAMRKLARRMSRIMGVPAAELLPSVSRLVVVEQLRQEALDEASSNPRKSG
jgi:hypothetical protein